MAEIIKINGSVVKIGLDGGKIVSVPITALSFANPKVGDEVKLYKDGNEAVVKKVDNNPQNTLTNDKELKKINKWLYLVVLMFIGSLGAHRFMRGQIGIGIVYILTLGGLGIACFVDLIISLTKLGQYDENFVFTARGGWVNTK